MSHIENNSIALCMIAGDDAIEEGIVSAMESAARQGVSNCYVSFNGTDYDAMDAISKNAMRFFKDCKVSEFEVNGMLDFSAARNHSFELAPEWIDWIIWLDCDDRLAGDLEGLLEEMHERRAHSAVVPYEYAEGVVHGKERFFRRDVQWEWTYPIHEVCRGPLSSREIASDKITVVHHRRNVEEKQTRNYRLIQWWFQQNPNEARAQMFMAHALLAQAENQQDHEMAAMMTNTAIKLYVKFIEQVGTTDDAYHCLVQMAGAQLALSETVKAQDTLMKAVMIRPTWSPAKLMMARIAKNAGDYEIAKNWVKDVLGVIVTQGGAVNTSIQNSNEEMEAAQLLQEIEEITQPDLFEEERKRMHDVSCFQDRGDKQKTIVIFTAPTAEPWSPDSIYTKGSGGTEMQIIQLANHLVYRGYRVRVYGTIERGWEGNENGLELWDTRRFHPDAPCDTFISVRMPEILKGPINAKQKILWLHDVNVGEVDSSAFSFADKIVVPSRWLANRTNVLYGNVEDPQSVFQVIPNGINFKAWNTFANAYREDGLLVYASSPDRGLERLLTMWPQIKAEIPNAKLEIYYGWDGMDAIIEAGGPQAPYLLLFKQKIINLIEKMNKAHGGITWVGRVSEKELRRKISVAQAVPYPANFHETFGIVFQQAMACGTPPVVSQMGALQDLIPRWLQVEGSPNSEMFTEPFVEALKIAVESHQEGETTFADGTCVDNEDLHQIMIDQAERCHYEWVHTAWDEILGIKEENR